MGEEIRDHIQNLKDEGIDVNINNDQVNDLVNKILKDINKRDLASKDSDIKTFLKKYENKPIETRYSSDIFGSDKIDSKEINSALANYDIKEITKDKFLQINNVFINKFDKLSEVMNKKQPGTRGPNQKELLDYGNELKKIIEKSFNPSGSGLKILTPQQMLARLPILLVQIKAGNNSRELKNEIRQLLYSLYR